jgi:hypothetical protein
VGESVGYLLGDSDGNVVGVLVVGLKLGGWVGLPVGNCVG